MKKIALFSVFFALWIVPCAFAQTPSGGYSSPATGSITNGAGSTNVIYAANPTYGGKFDVKYEWDCTFNSTTTVVCPKGNFTSADIGKIEFGTQTPYTSTPSNLLIATPLVVPQGTITGVTNSTTVTVSVAAVGNCTPTLQNNLCAFAWGTQDDAAAVALAQAAAWNGNNCLPVVYPAGSFFLGSGGFLSLASGAANACYNQSDYDQNGPEAYGQGQNATHAIPLPSFNFATCTNGSSTVACFGGAPNGVYHDFEVTGLGQSLPTTTHAVNLLELDGNSACTGAVMRNVHLAGWALQSTSTVGLTVEGACDVNVINVGVESFGTIGCDMKIGTQATNLMANGLICFSNGGTGAAGGELEIDYAGGGAFSSTGGYYGGCLTGTCFGVLINSQSVSAGNANIFSSSGDTIFGSWTNAQNVISVAGTAAVKMNFWGDNITQEGTLTGAGQLALCNNSGTGTIMEFAGSFLSAGSGVNNRLFDNIQATCTINDIGGNTFVDGGLVSTFTGPFVPYYSTIYPSTLQVASFVVGAAGTGACATITTQTGNKYNGTLKCTGVSGASTLTLTPGTTATNGWNCRNSQDVTTPANTFTQNSVGATTCVLTFATVTQNDVIMFNAQQF